MPVYLQLALGKAIQEDALRRAQPYWRGREPSVSPGHPVSSCITLRLAEARDSTALHALAGRLDFPDTVLVADVDGRIVGACSLDGKSSFTPPADPLIEDLLQLRAIQLRRAQLGVPRFRKAAIRGC